MKTFIKILFSVIFVFLVMTSISGCGDNPEPEIEVIDDPTTVGDFIEETPEIEEPPGISFEEGTEEAKIKEVVDIHIEAINIGAGWLEEKHTMYGTYTLTGLVQYMYLRNIAEIYDQEYADIVKKSFDPGYEELSYTIESITVDGNSATVTGYFTHHDMASSHLYEKDGIHEEYRQKYTDEAAKDLYLQYFEIKSEYDDLLIVTLIESYFRSMGIKDGIVPTIDTYVDLYFTLDDEKWKLSGYSEMALNVMMLVIEDTVLESYREEFGE